MAAIHSAHRSIDLIIANPRSHRSLNLQTIATLGRTDPKIGNHHRTKRRSFVLCLLFFLSSSVYHVAYCFLVLLVDCYLWFGCLFLGSGVNLEAGSSSSGQVSRRVAMLCCGSRVVDGLVSAGIAEVVDNADSLLSPNYFDLGSCTENSEGNLISAVDKPTPEKSKAI
ncbi:hypothetical protein QVD17_42014 [Tagetes erecta]|uniref:Uncharacterized protein n=1 Tax=Tagetes erecta TaxID=13708 RepID=A0AAD8NFZ9_TARER|nr:hypothetical protein QVD17_42014 [Tagetes erecta]